MNDSRDHYEAYYAGKLWNLLPAVYRAQDTDQFGTFGPLREMVNRIGAQAAILRRSIDRMWQDQSIETCDDWVISYIGDLLATNLVAGLDAASQRRDVAHTIYYRRRKGTVAVLEEIAADITGWDAKVVEFFRRMARTRNGLDPAIGLVLKRGDATDQLQQAQGLRGPLTRTPIGGTARLCNVYASTRTQSAFDEFYHTADFRYGQGHAGWHNIPRLGVFLWRLMSFETGPVTPVPVSGCQGWFTFDPTGRDIPLFSLSSRNADYYATQWSSPVESQLQGPITQALFDAESATVASTVESPPADSPPASCEPAKSSSPLLYPDSLAVFTSPSVQSTPEPLPRHEVVVRPERGRVQTVISPLQPVWLKYAYGFSDRTGAGPYDRRLVRNEPASIGTTSTVEGGGSVTIASSGTLQIQDSLTYNDAADVFVNGSLMIIAANEERPLLRFTPGHGWTEWQFYGAAGSSLVLDGLFVSGADIVLSGTFDSVTITCCSFDPGSVPGRGDGDFPGTSSPSSSVFAISADGRNLVPCRIWIEGNVRSLTVQRSVLGPIRTRNGGQVGTLSMTDSIVQGIRTAGWGDFDIADIKDPVLLQRTLIAAEDPVSQYLAGLPPIQDWLKSNAASPPDALPQLVAALNGLLSGTSLDGTGAFASVPQSEATRVQRAAAASPGAAAVGLNRSLLEDAYPLELADAALAVGDGAVSLSHCTILGRMNVHSLQASECILNDLAVVEDTQHGCVRFSCWTTGSLLPRKYESVETAPAAALFTSTDFGQPGYGQLSQTADSKIISTGNASTSSDLPTILSGAENGSEMGAFCLAQNSIKEEALLIKYQEYMPVGLVPVIIYAT